MTEWRETRMANKPEPIVLIGPDLYLQTRNVTYVSPEEGYCCETREVTESELKLIGEIENLNKTVEVINEQLLKSL